MATDAFEDKFFLQSMVLVLVGSGVFCLHVHSFRGLGISEGGVREEEGFNSTLFKATHFVLIS